jgi:hypothetical protein
VVRREIRVILRGDKEAKARSGYWEQEASGSYGKQVDRGSKIALVGVMG